MKPVWTERFLGDFLKLPAQVQEKTLRKLRYLAQDMRHPSLRVKRLRRRADVYEGSVNMGYRFLFRVTGDKIVLLRIGRHDILDKG
jgi:mRNA-degrading endonuclease RelE of RelBE toxin-antitoxin system